MVLRRNHILFAGLLLFLLGLQFRLVPSFSLNDRSSRFVSARLGDRGPQGGGIWQAAAQSRTIQPPRWLGLALMSAGAVLTIKSLSMRGAA
ncbi:MAG: hypothetical protein ACK6CT_15905 [Planctomycetia bacterium]|jgi:hypothetical protein